MKTPKQNHTRQTKPELDAEALRRLKAGQNAENTPDANLKSDISSTVDDAGNLPSGVQTQRIKCIYCNNPIHIDAFAGIVKKGYICNDAFCLLKLAKEISNTPQKNQGILSPDMPSVEKPLETKNKLPLIAIKGLISAMEDVKNGDYTTIESACATKQKSPEVFNLSSRIWHTEMPKGEMIFIEDIKEFIKLLKKEISLSYSSQENVVTIINELAGEKLL